MRMYTAFILRAITSNNATWRSFNTLSMFASEDATGPDLLLGGTATASHFGGSFFPQNAIDGNPSTTWEGSGATGQDVWFRVDLASPAAAPKSVRAIATTYPGEAITGFDLQGETTDGAVFPLGYVTLPGTANQQAVVIKDDQPVVSRFLVVGSETAPYLSAYSLSGGPQEYTGRLKYLPNVTACCADSQSGVFFIGHSASPFLTRVEPSYWVARTFAVPPTGRPNALEYSRSNGMFIAGLKYAPYLIAYAGSGFTPQAITSGSPTSAVTAVALSANGSYCAVSHEQTPFLTVYRTTDWSRVSLSSPIGAAATGIGFTPNGKLIVGGSFGVRAYSLSGGTATNITTGLNEPVVKLCVNKKTEKFASFHSSGFVRIGDASTFTIDRSKNLGVASGASSPISSEEGDIYCVYANARLYALDASSLDVRWAASITVNPSSLALLSPPERTIVGTVRDRDGLPAPRRVRAYNRSSGVLCATTTSDSTSGEYRLGLFEGDVEYDVQFLADDGETLNDLFFARVTSGTEG